MISSYIGNVLRRSYGIITFYQFTLFIAMFCNLSLVTKNIVSVSNLHRINNIKVLLILILILFNLTLSNLINYYVYLREKLCFTYIKCIICNIFIVLFTIIFINIKILDHMLYEYYHQHIKYDSTYLFIMFIKIIVIFIWICFISIQVYNNYNFTHNEIHK